MAGASTVGTLGQAVAARMIDVNVISKAFGWSEILKDIAFRVEDGETVAILGPSGIGKSTLLRLIAGIDTSFEGQIARPDRVAMVFQEPTLLPWRTTTQNIALIHPHLSDDAVSQALDRVGLADKSEMFPAQLSLGQRRRLALARAIAGQPSMLVLDEPFSSLDPETGADMLALTRRLIEDLRPSTVFVTHVMAEAEQLADRVLMLSGAPASLKA